MLQPVMPFGPIGRLELCYVCQEMRWYHWMVCKVWRSVRAAMICSGTALSWNMSRTESHQQIQEDKELAPSQYLMVFGACVDALSSSQCQCWSLSSDLQHFSNILQHLTGKGAWFDSSMGRWSNHQHPLCRVSPGHCRASSLDVQRVLCPATWRLPRQGHEMPWDKPNICTKILYWTVLHIYIYIYITYS